LDVAFVCIICYFGQSATGKLKHVFLVAGWWVTVDLDSKCKIRKLGPMGYLFMKKKKFKARICIIIPTPYNIQLTNVKGNTTLHKYAKIACIRQLYCLVDLTMDIYLTLGSLVQGELFS